MLDPIAVERAEKSLDEFINSRSKAKDEANAEVARQREIDLKRLAAMREENRSAWCEYLRRVAAAHLRIARSARARARRLEQGETI